MVSINYAFREISCKIVYYGPGLSGKTTNLQCVHDRLPSKSRGDLISLATEADRTLYFDFLPLSIGDIGGFATKFQMYTVPGQVFYNATRKLVLRGVDGIVFVADSQPAKMDDNLESLADMFDNLKSYGLNPADIPIVMQYNKRDLPDVASVEELEAKLNPEAWPYIKASAVNGNGVFDTVKKISKMVLADIKSRTASDGAGALPSGAPSVAVPTAGLTAEPLPKPKGAPLIVSADRPAPVREAAAAVMEPPDEGVDITQLKPESRPQQTKIQSVGGTVRQRSSGTAGPTIIAAQKSTRVRRRKRTLFERLFGWLISR